MCAKRANSIDQSTAQAKKAKRDSAASQDEGKFVDGQQGVEENAIVDEEDQHEKNIDSALEESDKQDEADEAVNPDLFINEPYAAAAAAQQSKQASGAVPVNATPEHAVSPVQQHLTDITGEKKNKPEKDSEEYHRQRKESHKEVERRRRENINAGIRELAALLPSAETHKYLILVKATEYIKRLKENETNNTEKWTLEKLLKEQTNAELSASNEKLKNELERAYRELEHWKKLAQSK